MDLLCTHHSSNYTTHVDILCSGMEWLWGDQYTDSRPVWTCFAESLVMTVGQCGYTLPSVQWSSYDPCRRVAIHVVLLRSVSSWCGPSFVIIQRTGGYEHVIMFECF
jgi:hypothetical protein